MNAMTILAAAAALSASPALAGTVAFTGMDDQGRSAKATFTSSGAMLTVLLENTAAVQSADPSWLLTGLFFNTGGAKLQALSATLPDGSSLLYAGSNSGVTDVSGEWAHVSGRISGFADADHGVGAAGFGIFGPHDVIGGSNIAGPVNVGGMDFGITAAADAAAVKQNKAVTGQNPLIRNAVLFTFAVDDLAFEVGDLSHVAFQYGTSLSEPAYAATFAEYAPDPGVVPVPSAAMAGVVMLGLLPLRRLLRR